MQTVSPKLTLGFMVFMALMVIKSPIAKADLEHEYQQQQLQKDGGNLANFDACTKEPVMNGDDVYLYWMGRCVEAVRACETTPDQVVDVESYGEWKKFAGDPYYDSTVILKLKNGRLCKG